VAYPSICQQFPKPWKVETPGKRERGSVVDWGTMLQTERSWDWVPMRWISSVYLTLPVALRPWGRLSL
jgi:hypothetical protein